MQPVFSRDVVPLPNSSNPFPELLLGRISSQVLKPGQSIFRALARSDQLPDTKNLASSFPELLLDRISSRVLKPGQSISRAPARSDQLPGTKTQPVHFSSSCSVESASGYKNPANSFLELLLGRINSRVLKPGQSIFHARARSDQLSDTKTRPVHFPSSCSVGSLPSPCSVGSTPAQSDQLAFRTNLTPPGTDGSTQDLIFSTLIEKVFSGGNDMANIDLTATSSCPRTIRPLAWPTQHSGAGLTHAWRGQQSCDRPNMGKVGEVDTPQLQEARHAPHCKDHGGCGEARRHGKQ
ncbi:hypothetical protein B296_00039959 [Ensete ventricosum]|uniref:Uncharacterized protein n=1 Tax=Ensete ventricosum TaxID=4639 RepID=A0A426XBM3_ENSVE|nr:hypothetical protein B296_00039959 [Ensete ventricosum]